VGLDKQPSKESKRRRKMEELLAFDRFAAEQGGTYTSQMVCAFLKLTIQGVDYAARTGGLKYVCFGRNRFYGKKSVQNYRWSLSRKFKDNPRLPFSPGQAHQPWKSEIYPPPEHYEQSPPPH
jgi:hypothetical protein